MKRDYRLFIRDIFEAIENIEYFIGNMDFDEFYDDDKTRSAVVWKIGIIGEATKITMGTFELWGRSCRACLEPFDTE